MPSRLAGTALAHLGDLLLLTLCLVSCVQGLAIVIVLVTAALSKNNIEKIIADYSYDSDNAAAISELQDAITPLRSSMAFNSLLVICMLAGFAFSAFTLGKPLRERKSAAAVHEH